VQRILRGRDEIRIMLRYPEAERRRLDSLEHMRIRTAQGAEVPLSEVATMERQNGFPSIKRENRKRVIGISAEIDNAIIDPNKITEELQSRLFPEIIKKYPGVKAALSGSLENQVNALRDLAIGFGFALFGMYALMAVAFRSYTQPVLIMTAIPFGIVGAILGHLLMGYDLSMLSIMGIIALAGVVVNDNIVLIDAINEYRAQGKPIYQAVLTAAHSRFRAVMLTTLTTFVGLAPLMGETSIQAQFLIPMAVSLAFGVLFATAITLILVPIIYIVLEDVVRAVRWAWYDAASENQH
jgi:multidrug efflux pump subunit AcrB